MLNFNFIKGQFKTVWINILCFLIIFTILVAFVNISASLAPRGILILREDDSLYGTTETGAATFLNKTIFGFGSLAVFGAFGISMNMILINRDINRGYVVSWLTTPISRKSIFNSKLFVLIISTIALNFWIILIEMICFSIRMADFKTTIGYLLLGNFSLICYSLMIVSVCWFIFAIFNKAGIALGILLGLIGWFALCEILTSLTIYSGLEKLEYFKYFTIQSIFNSPLKFVEPGTSEPPVHPEKPGTYIEYVKLLPLKALDFAWQLPSMLIMGTGFFVGGQFIIKNKDFSF